MLPAIRVVRTSAASFFISGSLPSHEKNVTVVGDVGSLTGPAPSPFWESPDGSSESLPHAARPKDEMVTRAATTAAFRDSLNLTESAPLLLERQLGDPRHDPMQIVWLLGGKHPQRPRLCQWIPVVSVTSGSHRDVGRRHAV